MLLTLADPVLSELLANGAPAPVVVDFLADRDDPPTLAEVLSLYAGTWEKDWTDGLPQKVLAEWCKRTDTGQVFAGARYQKEQRTDLYKPRWQAVHEMLAIMHRRPNLRIRLGDHAAEEAEQTIAIAIAIRDRKRRTLALFGEVEGADDLVPIEEIVAVKAAEERLRICSEQREAAVAAFRRRHRMRPL